MSLSKKLLAFIDEAKRSDSYWVEKAKLGFAMSLERWRRLSGLSNKELAEKIDTSPAYITKVFRGDTNFTIETMVKLARACGGRLDIQIVDAGVSARTWASVARQPVASNYHVDRAPFVALSSATTVPGEAANDWISQERYAFAA